MGVRIGQMSVAPMMRTAASQGYRISSEPGRAARLEEANPFNRADRVDIVSAGFGDNTLSPGAAALQTLDSNLRSSRNISRKMEEIRASLRAQRDEQQQRQQEAGEPPDVENPPEEAKESVAYRPTAQPQALTYAAAPEPVSSPPATPATTAALATSADQGMNTPRLNILA